MTFTIPLTFYNTACLDSNSAKISKQLDAIESTILSSKATTLKSWSGGNGSGIESGLVIGCEDGTLYMFRGCPEDDLPVERPVERQKRRVQHSAKRSRASSPLPNANPLSPTLAVAPRASVVLGVSTEQVQAPRNYVDFDDEPGRLKDILKGKNPRERERVSSDSASLVTISPAPSTIVEKGPERKGSGSPAKSLYSTADSSITRPQSPSSPTSLQGRSSDPTQLLSIQYHIIPTHSGRGNAVRAIEVIEDNTLVVSLQASGYIGVHSLADGSCQATAFAPDYCGNRNSRDIWTWCSLQPVVLDEAPALLVTAATDSNTSAATPDAEENSSEKSQTIVLKLAFTPNSLRIDKLAGWEIEGPAKGIGIYKEPDNSSTLYSINSQGHFLVHNIKIPSPSESTSPTPPPADTDTLSQISSLPLSRSFKAIVGRSPDTLPVHQTAAPNSITNAQLSIDDTLDMGSLISDSTLSGLSTRHANGKLYGIAWAHREMTVFQYHAYKLHVLLHTTAAEVEDVEWLDDETYALSYQERIDVYKLQRSNADSDRVVVEEHGASHHSPTLVRQIPTGGHDSSTFSPSRDLIITKLADSGHRQLVSFSVPLDSGEDKGAEKSRSTLLWQSSRRQQEKGAAIVQTSSVPLEFDVIVQGFSDGRLRQYSLEQMAFRNSQTSSSAVKQSEPPIAGSIVSLHIAHNPRTKERYVVGGADDGSILFWNINTFELCARWIVYSTPLVRVVEFQESAGPLRGCVLCISQAGTIAVIAVDGFQFLYLIPGSPSPLTRISLGDNNLVLIYGESIARLWDVQTKEFWRSMTVDKAEEMFKQGGWTSLDIASGISISVSQWNTVAPAVDGIDAAATLEFSLDKFVIDCISLTKTISTSRDEIKSVLQVLERLKYLLSIVVTLGLNNDVDSICTGKLKLRQSTVGVGLVSLAATTLYSVRRPQDAWTISENVSAARMLAIVFILRAMGLFEELSEAANSVVAFYTLSLPACVGPNYAPPSLEWLGKRWFTAATDLRQSIRTVFDATLAHINDQDAMKLAEKWQHHVPSLQPAAERESEVAALSLLICGCIATEKFTLLSVSALTNISTSLALYLHDENSNYRALAIELCSKGFHVWQHYVDTMEILRALFSLSTASRKDSISLQNIGAQARLAVLNIATQHTALFMSTLCLDVLNPPSLEHRRSVMQIIAFLIRKRRHILQPNLPRLMEAVVKSLDPNSNANREAVLDTATEIIGFVVKHFPSVDFHMNTQRLAVGTNEGAVVMYDLKTAIRLYVLEGHKKLLTACSFSPDGRRLVTLSLVEQAVLVWKVGSSFSSFFNPGAPPRQGHGGSEPFKTLNFHIGQEAEMTMEETLELIGFEWVADRSVKVKIRASVLTFST